MESCRKVKLNTSGRRSFKDIKVNAETFTHFFCFLSVLLIGADLIGVNIGINLRLDQLFLIILALLLAINGKFRFTYNFCIIAFAALAFVSTLGAFSFKRGALFYFSIIYNIVFIFYTFSNYVKTYGLSKFIEIFRKTCYAQFVIFLFQYFLKIVLHYEFSFLPTYGSFMGVPRFRLWFYEPSYMANYFVFWFAVSVYQYLIGKRKSYLKDVIICLIMLILCTSTTGLLGMALVIVGVYLLWFVKGVTIRKLIFPLTVLILCLVLYLVFTDILNVFIGRLFSGSLDAVMGGRITGWTETFNVFKAKPFFGVGPGNYGLYLGEDAGYVPTNVTLELMSTVGIFATIAFYGLALKQVVSSVKIYRRNKNEETMLLAACALGLMIFTIILQVNQGYLRLYHWMFFGIIEGAILRYRQKSVRGK